VAGLSRADLLARGGKGAALLVAGSALGFVPEAATADTFPDGDLAYARLFVTVELLALDFYGSAIASKHFDKGRLADLRRARADEKQHYDSAAAFLVSAGQVPATAADIDFSYPRGSFVSKRAIARLGVRLESTALGGYLGAVEGYESNALKQLAARAAASEAQHLSVFAAEVGGRRIGAAFPRPLTIDRVFGALDAFTS
jgi:ferritin-like protein